MKKLFIPIVLIGLCVLGSGCNQENDELVIGVVGDQHGSYDHKKTYEIMDKGVKQLKEHHPDIVLHVGDMVESIMQIESYKDYEDRFKRAVSIMNQFDVPWYIVPGDHDVNPPQYKQKSEDHSREEWFRKLAVKEGFPYEEKLYYSADLKGYHFVFLNALEYLHTDPRWGGIFLNKMKDAQKEWLKKDLEKNKRAKGIIVVIHHPQWYVWSNWMEVHNILKQYPVSAVIAGHYHYDQDGGVVDDIHYMVIGATGGVVKDCDRHSGGSQQYAVLKAKGRKITDVTLYDVEKGDTLEFTPRQSMDRIQAVATMLGNTYGDEKLFVKRGKLVDASGKRVRTIGLESLLNPLDIPITLHVEVEGINVKDSYWNDQDGHVSGVEDFVLQPAERIGWANYTNVGNWRNMNPLWEAIPEEKVYSAKDTVSLIIKASFTDTRERWVRYEVSYPVNELRKK